MSDQLSLVEGTQNKALSQWFTPRETAKRIVDFAFGQRHHDRMLNILEPSAGRGALVEAIADHDYAGYITAVDIDPQNHAALIRAMVDTVIIGDFLAVESFGCRFDLAVMNPPFEGGQTERHIMHALKFADRVVCHCPLTTLAGKARRENLWSQVQLHRLAICSTRPKYGADGGKTDMCTIDVTLCRHPNMPDWAHDVKVEFWP